MRIFSGDLARTINEVRVAVAVTATHDILQQELPDERNIGLFLSGNQAAFNEGMPQSDIDRFENVTGISAFTRTAETNTSSIT